MVAISFSWRYVLAGFSRMSASLERRLEFSAAYSDMRDWARDRASSASDSMRAPEEACWNCVSNSTQRCSTSDFSDCKVAITAACLDTVARSSVTTCALSAAACRSLTAAASSFSSMKSSDRSRSSICSLACSATSEEASSTASPSAWLAAAAVAEGEADAEEDAQGEQGSPSSSPSSSASSKERAVPSSPPAPKGDERGEGHTGEESSMSGEEANDMAAVAVWLQRGVAVASVGLSVCVLRGERSERCSGVFALKLAHGVDSLTIRIKATGWSSEEQGRQR